MGKIITLKKTGRSITTGGCEPPMSRPRPASRLNSFRKTLSTMSKHITEPWEKAAKPSRESSSWLPLDLKAHYCEEVYGYRDANMDDRPFGHHRDSVEMMRPAEVMEAVLSRMVHEDQEQGGEERWGTVSLSGLM